MSIAITTKYLGPTNHRAARVKATSNRGSITVSWNHALDVESNHVDAVHALARKLGFTAHVVDFADSVDGKGLTFVATLTPMPEADDAKRQISRDSIKEIEDARTEVCPRCADADCFDFPVES